MFRIVLSCDGVPDHAGPQAAREITDEFAQRPWHRNVKCTWDGNISSLILQAENDFDNDGHALMDEFSDAISASIKEAGDGDIRVLSITNLPNEVAP